MNRNTLFSLIVTISLFSACSAASAGVIVGGTRVIYDGNKKETSLSVRNPDNIPYLIQSWADNNGPKGDRQGGAEAPFIVTPPLFRLDRGKDNVVRIMYKGTPLPQDRESVFWMNVKSIPASDTSAKNVLQLSVKTRIKLFYRPAGLREPAPDEWRQVTFTRAGRNLSVSNPTPFFISFYSLNVAGKSVDTTDIMVPPLGTASYNLPSDVTGSDISWQFINKFGGNSQIQKARLN